MTSLDAICGVLAQMAPLKLAEDWDNVGLLVGDRRRRVERLMTCLTITPNVVEEAVGKQATLIVTHHPLPFQPVSRITSDTITGSMLWTLIGHGIAVYSAHTAFDSASEGINQMWGELLELVELQPLIDSETGYAAANHGAAPGVIGAGRYGRLAEPQSLRQVVSKTAKEVGASAPRLVGDPDRTVNKLALACGSGGSFLSAAARHGCDAMLTGEATFHLCLEAESRGIGLGLLGHYHSERFAMERMADRLAQLLPDVVVWASQDEHDPISQL